MGNPSHHRTLSPRKPSLTKKALAGFIMTLGVLFCFPVNAQLIGGGELLAGGTISAGTEPVEGTPLFVYDNVVWQWNPDVDSVWCSFSWRASISGSFLAVPNEQLHIEVGQGGTTPQTASWVLDFAYASTTIDGTDKSQNLGVCLTATAGTNQWLRFTVSQVPSFPNYLLLHYANVDTVGLTTVWQAKTTPSYSYTTTTRHAYGGFGGIANITQEEFNGFIYATSITAVIPPGSLESGALNGYVPGTFWTLDATTTISTQFQDKANSFLGAATGTFPMCLTYPWFSLIDFFVGNTTGTATQSLTIAGAGIIPTTTLSLAEFPDVLADTAAKPVLDPIIAGLQALAWLSLGLYIFTDVFGKKEQNESD